MSSLYKYTFYTLFISTFLLGGFFQFFFGFSNTLYTYFLTLLILSFYIIYVLIKQRIIVNKITLLFFLLTLLILFSGFVNKTSILKIIIYLVFVLLPLGTYLFFKINVKENYISHIKLSKLYLLVACIQLPVIFIQLYGFDYIIPFSRSSQSIASFDFLFGTFFLKADHALGFFLLINIINIIENNSEKKITKYPLLVYAYIGVTIFVSESNISKLLLIVLVGYLLYKKIPKKIKKTGTIILLILSLLTIPTISKIPFLEREITYMKAEYNIEKSYRNFKAKIAKRPQVVIAYLGKLPLKIVGDGPYSYYNILKGKFSQTNHFSQLIWTYADLGILGVLLFISILYFIVKDLQISMDLSLLVFGCIVVFSFMTTIFSDIAIMISLTSILKRKTNA